MSNDNYRKITAGDNFANCIAYVKGAKYLGRTIRITDIALDESGEFFNIYITSENEDSGKALWKSVSKNNILEIEYDLNFE